MLVQKRLIYKLNLKPYLLQNECVIRVWIRYKKKETEKIFIQLSDSESEVILCSLYHKTVTCR